MDVRRLAELLEPFLAPASSQRLTTNDLSNISTYIDLLTHWNARINLTAIRDPEQIVTRHFGESLFAACHLFPDRTVPLSSRHAVEGPWVTADMAGRVGTGAFARPAERSEAINGTNAAGGPQNLPRPCGEGRDTEGLAPSDTKAAERRQNAAHGVSRGLEHTSSQALEGRKKLSLADVGSGPGFPGLPIKLWAPDISLTLIESNQKKATFLREVTRTLTLTDVNIQSARAESLSAEVFDIVSLRAVEHFDQILPTAATLVNPKGRLALLIGSSQIAQAKSILPTLTWSHPHPIPQSNSRNLVIGLK